MTAGMPIEELEKRKYLLLPETGIEEAVEGAEEVVRLFGQGEPGPDALNLIVFQDKFTEKVYHEIVDHGLDDSVRMKVITILDNQIALRTKIAESGVVDEVDLFLHPDPVQKECMSISYHRRA